MESAEAGGLRMNSPLAVSRSLDPPRSVFGRISRESRHIAAIPGFAALAGDDWDDRVMLDSTAEVLHTKQGRSISYWSLSDRARPFNLYLKRHYRLPRWLGLLAALWPARAWSPGLAEWEHLRWAEDHDIPVARPVAAGEFRGPWGRLQSFLAVEELREMLPLHEAIPLAARHLSPVAFARWKRGLIGELARLTRELHRRRMYHKDLYLCHFYMPESDCRSVPDSFAGRIHMIDFHRLARHRFARHWFQVKDLAQLLYSTGELPEITSRDRFRFWKLYCSGDWGVSRPPRRWLRWAVLKKWTLYDRHNRKHRLERKP